MLLTAPFEERDVTHQFPDELIESWSKVAGWAFATGRLTPEGDKILFFTKKRSALNSLVESLSQLDIPFNIKKVTGNHYYHFELTIDANSYSGGIRSYLSTGGFSVVQEVMKLPIAARKIFVDEMLAAGGLSKGKKYVKKWGLARHFWYISDDQAHLDVAQTLIMSSGYAAVKKQRINSEGTLNYVNVRCAMKNRQLSSVENETIQVVPYSGTIYCYNVPNHLFVTRRNGRTCINGNTANRATSDNMSRNLVDSVKDIQRVIEAQFTEFVIKELLLESTFGDEVLDDEFKVQLKFKEIDLSYQIKKEAHYADQFQKDVISQNEARLGMGRQPIRYPTVEEVESDPDVASRYPEWYGSKWKLIAEPQALIQAVDEPYSAAAIAAAESASTDVTTSQLATSSKEKQKQEIALEKEKSKAKVAVAKAKPKPTVRKDSATYQKYRNLQSEALSMVNGSSYSNDWMAQIAFVSETEMIRDLKARAMAAFSSGYRSVNPRGEQQINATIRNRSKIEDRVNFYVHRVIDQTVNALKRHNIDSLDKDARIQKVKAAFDAIGYRADFIDDVEVTKAYNLGIIEAARDQGKTSWTLEVSDSSCTACKLAAEQSYPITDALDLDSIPPLHAGSKSKIKIL
jgi:hypothetical protein